LLKEPGGSVANLTQFFKRLAKVGKCVMHKLLAASAVVAIVLSFGAIDVWAQCDAGAKARGDFGDF
jgi:hypothetical protein